MRKVILCILASAALFGFLTIQTVHAVDIDHPYFHTEEYKKIVEQFNLKKAELQNLHTELKTIQEQRKQFSWEDSGIIEFVSFLPFSSYIILLLSLSLFLAAIYLYYIKVYNPAKWFILFKTRNNLGILLKRIKEHNKLILVLCAATLILPSVSLAETSIVTDAKYFLFGNEVERGYVFVKYPVKGRKLPYDRVKDISIYPVFDENTFEHHYNYLVHEFAIGFPPKTTDLVRLIEKVRSVEALHTTYDFIFKLGEAGTIREVVQKRLSALPRLRMDTRFIEIDAILTKAKETNLLNLVGEDLAAALNLMIPEVSGTSSNLQMAYLLVDVDPNKANELFDRIKYKFQDIISEPANESRFRAAYLALSKIRPEIYRQGDSLGLDDQNDPTTMVAVALFFDKFDERLSSSIIKNFHLDRTTKIKQEPYEHLAGLWKKYRKEEVPAFFDLFTSQFIRYSRGNLNTYLNIASRLGYSKDDAVDFLIKHDAEYHGLKSESSTLITKEFMNLISADGLSKHLNYLKTRNTQAPLILNSLLEKRYDLFPDYLMYSYEKDPRMVSKLTFQNKLAGFTKWDGLVGNQFISDYRVPATYYLSEKELSAPTPKLSQVIGLLQENVDERMVEMILMDNRLGNPSLLDELMLFHLYSKMTGPPSADVRTVLEASTGSQTKARMDQQMSSIDSELQKVRGQVQSARSELDNFKSRKRSAQIRITAIWILVILTVLYIISAFFLSIRYSINAVSAYSGTRIGLFTVVFAETFAKFLVPILYFTVVALVVIIGVQLYGFLRSRDEEFPNVQRSLANYRDSLER